MHNPIPIMPGAALVQLLGPAETIASLVDALDGLPGWVISSDITRERSLIYDQAALILAHTPETVDNNSRCCTDKGLES